MPADVGVRREDKSAWERRTPLIPEHVRALAQEGIRLAVQPSKTRVFSDQEFKAAGAQVIEDLSECRVVFAVKEIPPTFFRSKGVYVFFSHTIKGQPYNMPMLKRMMDLGCTLIDYEKVEDERGKRLIFFGRYAGIAGMIETLVALGRRLKSQGINSPFAALKPPHEYDSVREIKSVLEVVGHWIHTNGLPEEVLPLTIGFAGYGNVSQGAQEMLDILPVTKISPGELHTISTGTKGVRNTIFKAVFKEEDIVIPKDTKHAFALQDYYDNPDKYTGTFDRYLPYLSVLVNCIYWDEKYPRLVTKDYLKRNWSGTRLSIIGDISCDINGSIEATSRVTEPDEPTFVYDPETDSTTPGWQGRGVVIMAIDILPSELPRDASIYFSNVLREYVPVIARAEFDADFDDLVLPIELKKALILHRGELTPAYEYIANFLKQQSS